MRYRVIRDIGSADYPVGAVIDGAALDQRRLTLLTEQRRIESIEPTPPQLAEAQAQRLAVLEAKVADLTTQNAQLASALEAAQGDQSGTPNLTKLKVDDLKALAAERGIEGAASMKRDDLIAALTAEQEAPDE